MSFMQLEIISFLFPLFEIDSMRKRSTGRREICRIQRPPVLPGAVHCTPSSGEILHLTRGTVATSVGVPSGGRRGLAPFQEYGKPWTGPRNFSKSRRNFLTGKYGPAPEEWGERGVKVAPIDHHTGPQSSFADRPLWHCHIRCNASPRLPWWRLGRYFHQSSYHYRFEMGRPQFSPIHQYFDFEKSIHKSVCKNFRKTLKGKHPGCLEKTPVFAQRALYRISE